MKKMNKVFYGILLLSFFGFIFSHWTPEGSVRTKVFFSGYFKTSLSAEIVKIDEGSLFYEPENEQMTYYQISPAPFEKGTNTPLKKYQVEKKLGLFFSSYYSDI